MGRETEIELMRRVYAKQVMAAAVAIDRRVEKAFATVPREHYLGVGPWPILRWVTVMCPAPAVTWPTFTTMFWWQSFRNRI